MHEFLKLLFSLSLSGASVALVLFTVQRLLRNTLSKGWRYYIWLVVFARLLLPITLPVNPVGILFAGPPVAAAAAEYAAITQESTVNPLVKGFADAPTLTIPATSPDPQAQIPAATIVFAVWGIAALVLLVHKTTQYHSFSRYLHAGSAPVTDPALLDRYAEVSVLAGVARPPELRNSTLVTTPMLVGICKPYIVLPVPVADDTLEKVLLHELLHHKRRDILYKWFAQLALCLHWFNPMVWLAVRALEQDCELACDEHALRLMRPEERKGYGDALLQAVQTEGSYRSEVASLALSENAKHLKERLGLIMHFRTRTRAEKLFAVCLSAALCVGSVAMGAYAADTPPSPGLIPAKPKSAPSSVVSASQMTQPAVNADASTPEGTLELAMQSIKVLDIDALCRYSNNNKTTKSQALFSESDRWNDPSPVLFGGTNPKQDALFREVVRSLTWKPGTPAISGDTAKIPLTVTNRDFSGVMADIISQALFEAASDDNKPPYDPESSNMVSLMKSVADNKTIALTVTAKLRKVNGAWQLQIDSAFANAVCGNLLDGPESKDSKVKVAAAEKKMEEYIQKHLEQSIDWDAIERDLEEARKEMTQALEDAQEELDRTYAEIMQRSQLPGK